jgi:LDH2 family malate/lactate/ureidoglycolate dehydrogenase
MPLISVEELLFASKNALQGQGLSEELSAEIAEEFVVAELAGTKTHGVGKLVSLHLGDLKAKPNIVEHGSILSVDGNAGNGFVLFRQLAELVSQRCSKMGIVAAFVRNFSRYSALYPYTVRLAQNGFVGILTNTAGPAAVAPFGSVDPITGTNPICFSFPTLSGVRQTFDFSTSEVVWGEIRQAALQGRGGDLGFERQVEMLLNSIRVARPDVGNGRVRCPGDRGIRSVDIKKHLAEQIKIPESVIQMMDRMSKGEKISDFAANPLFN